MREAHSVYQKNPFLSISEGSGDFIVAYTLGRMKVLKCIPSVLCEVLELFDNECDLNEAIDILNQKYPIEDIKYFLKSLISADIIISDNNKTNSCCIRSDWCDDNNKYIMRQPSIVLIGRGAIADAVRKQIYMDLTSISDKSVEPWHKKMLYYEYPYGKSDSQEYYTELLHNLGCGILIWCPDECTIGELIAINDICLNLNIPFVSCYYNGKEILLGPTVIPGKTPCFGCLFEHRRCFMSDKGQVALRTDHLLPLKESWSMEHRDFHRSVIEWVATHVVAEAGRLMERDHALDLVKKQLRVPLHVACRFEEIAFEPITSCPSCCGMNRSRLQFGRPSRLDHLRSYEIALEEKPIVYLLGGRRSVSAGEARKLIDEAMERAGLEVRVERQTHGALDGILFRYTATIRSKYNAQLPFHVHGDLTQRGKGITEEQAYLSAAFELFERLSSKYYGDVEMIRATFEEVADIAVNPQACIGEVFHRGEMERFSRSAPIDWVWGYSLVRGSPILVPASMVFLTESKFMGHFYDNSSGGLSAGATIEDAILQGLLETVEHDAWMIWQANALTLPRIRPETVEAPRVAPVLEDVRALGFKVVSRNYTTDLSIPVFRTWIVNEGDYRCYATSGFGANLDPNLALERSVSEAWQPMEMGRTEEKLKYRSPSNTQMVFSYYSLHSLHHFNQLEILEDSVSLDYRGIPNQATESVCGDIRKILFHMQRCIPAVDVVVVNHTKQAFGVPVVRIVVQGGLQRFAKPTLSGVTRLFELPRELGYRKNRLSYLELFNGPFPH